MDLLDQYAELDVHYSDKIENVSKRVNQLTDTSKAAKCFGQRSWPRVHFENDAKAEQAVSELSGRYSGMPAENSGKLFESSSAEFNDSDPSNWMSCADA